MLFARTTDLVQQLQIARRELALESAIAKLDRYDLLILDDWAMAPLLEPERRDFWEICEDRYQTRSMILTSQLPVARWHEQVGDPTVADGILDRRDIAKQNVKLVLCESPVVIGGQGAGGLDERVAGRAAAAAAEDAGRAGVPLLLQHARGDFPLLGLARAFPV